METVTWIIGGTLLTLVGGLGGRLWSDRTKVSKAFCALRHESMDKLAIEVEKRLSTKFEGLATSMKRIEFKIDKINGGKP